MQHKYNITRIDVTKGIWGQARVREGAVWNILGRRRQRKVITMQRTHTGQSLVTFKRIQQELTELVRPPERTERDPHANKIEEKHSSSPLWKQHG